MKAHALCICARPHPGPFHTYMLSHFLSAVDLPHHAFHILASCASDPDREAQTYEAKTKTAGGIDLQMLGLGSNGHIASNEPGSPATSVTRAVTLTAQTRRDNQAGFPDKEDVPERAITMGLATILSARKLGLLATGPKKAGAVAKLVYGPVSSDWPCTALMRHHDVTVIIDADASADL